MKMLSLATAVALMLAAVAHAAPPKTFAPKQSLSPKSFTQTPRVTSPPRLSIPKSPPRFTPPKSSPRVLTPAFPQFRTIPNQPRLNVPAPRTSPKFNLPRNVTPPSTTPRLPDTRGFRALPESIQTPPNFGPRVLRPGDVNVPPRDVAPEGHREQFLDRSGNAFRPPTVPNVTPRLPDTRLRPEVIDLFKQPNLPREPNQPPAFDRSAIRPDIAGPRNIRPDLLDRIRPEDLRPRLPEGMFPQPEEDRGNGASNDNRPQGNPGQQGRPDQDRPEQGAPIPIPDDWGPLPIPEQLPDRDGQAENGGAEAPPNGNQDPQDQQPDQENPNEDHPQENPPQQDPNHNGPQHGGHGHHPGRPRPLGPFVPDIFIDLFCGNHNIGYCVPGVVIQPGVGLGQYVTPIEPDLIPALPRVENGDEVTLLLDEPIALAEGVELRAVLVIGDRPMLIEVTDLQPTLVQVQLPTLLITGSEPATILLGLSSSGEVVYDRQLLIVPIDD